MGQRVGQHYEGAAGAEYFAYQSSNSGITGARLNAAKFQRHIEMGDTIVDFGCGSGLMLEQLVAPGPGRPPRVDITRIGIEPNSHARAEGQARGLQIVASAAALDDESADIVISNHALEHATNPHGELTELRRILRPHGRLVLYLPLDDWRAQKNHAASDPNHHLYTWTPLLLGNLLGEAGFHVQKVRVVTSAWPPRVARARRLLPWPLFDATCWAMAIVTRRRQLVAVCLVR